MAHLPQGGVPFLVPGQTRGQTRGQIRGQIRGQTRAAVCTRWHISTRWRPVAAVLWLDVPVLSTAWQEATILAAGWQEPATDRRDTSRCATR